MFVSFYTELGNSSIADERVFLLHFILQQGYFSLQKLASRHGELARFQLIVGFDKLFQPSIIDS